MSPTRDLTSLLTQIDDLNEVCRAFRQAYLRANPQAKPNRLERRYADAVAYVQQRYQVDLTPR